jgi:competence protein ComEA
MVKWQEIGARLVKTFLLVFAIVLGGGIVYWGTRQPLGTPILLQEVPSPAPIVVHISGAVRQPGVYSLPYGSRLQDGLLAAGGLSENANPDALNLAAPLEDGQRVVVATARPTPAPTEEATRLVNPPTQNVFPIDINYADSETLQQLPDIGPIFAERIIAYREANGLFGSIEEIQNVPGIGPKTYENIKDLICVTP